MFYDICKIFVCCIISLYNSFLPCFLHISKVIIWKNKCLYKYIKFICFCSAFALMIWFRDYYTIKNIFFEWISLNSANCYGCMLQLYIVYLSVIQPQVLKNVLKSEKLDFFLLYWLFLILSLSLFWFYFDLY